MARDHEFTGYADFYDAVYRIMDDLQQAGESAWRTRIDNTLYGATSGEIFPPLRHELRELRASDVAARLELEDRLDHRVLYVLFSEDDPAVYRHTLAAVLAA